MSTSILATKLFFPPRRQNRVVRSRLIERLHAGVHGKLTLVAAPAGFGKTTLIAEWLAGSARSAAWLSLDEADNDPTRFLTYLLAALRTALPELARGVWDALHSRQPPPLHTLMADLVNELAAIPEGLSVVFDDYHVIDSVAVDGALTFLLDQLPSRMHVVIITREDPRLPLARLRARGQLSELRAHDLKFNASEAAEFLLTTAGLDLSPEEIDRLETRTEGWIAGLQLAALSMRAHEDTAGFIASFTGSHRFVLDYLVEEVLQQQPEEVQAFLLRTSILDRLCAPLCDAVLEEAPGSGRAMLEAVEDANLFIVPLDDERRWYRYHHLFAELLRQRLQQTVGSAVGGSDEVGDLHRRASTWLEHHGLRTEAFHHAVAANDVAHAESIVAGEGLPMHLRAAAAPVLDWLEGLPAETLNDRPSLWLLYASALLMSGKNIEAARKLEAAEAAMRDVEESDANRDLFGRIASFRATFAIMQSDAETIMSQSRRALEYLDEGNLPDRAAATWTLGYAHRLRGDDAAASRAFSEVIVLGERFGDSMYTVAAILMLGQLQEGRGQLSLATRSFERVLELEGDPPKSMACEAHLGLARIAYARNDLSSAQDHAQCSLLLAHQIQGVDTVASYGVLLARIRLAEDDVPGAEAALDDAETFVHRHGFAARLPDVAAERVRTSLRQFGAKPPERTSGATAPLATPGYALQEPMSERELEILRLIAEGMSNREIAERLFRALDTIKGNIRRVYGKLEVGSRTEAVARAHELGLL